MKLIVKFQSHTHPAIVKGDRADIRPTVRDAFSHEVVTYGDFSSLEAAHQVLLAYTIHMMQNPGEISDAHTCLNHEDNYVHSMYVRQGDTTTLFAAIPYDQDVQEQTANVA